MQSPKIRWSVAAVAPFLYDTHICKHTYMHAYMHFHIHTVKKALIKIMKERRSRDKKRRSEHAESDDQVERSGSGTLFI
jgi:hypothetical protein